MVGNRIKELRLSKNLSQAQLGKIIGASYSAISYWELNINEPKASFIVAICKYFNVSADYLLGLTDY